MKSKTCNKRPQASEFSDIKNFQGTSDFSHSSNALISQIHFPALALWACSKIELQTSKEESSKCYLESL